MIVLTEKLQLVDLLGNRRHKRASRTPRSVLSHFFCQGCRSKSGWLGVALFALLFNTSCFAIEIIGEGWGDTEAVAKREALADISSQISITVRSKFKTSQTVNATTVGRDKSETVNVVSENNVETDSELPILGAQFVTRDKGRQVQVKAVLDSAASLRMYESRLYELRERLTRLDARVTQSKSSEEKYHGIMEMLALLDEFRKLGTVALYLGGKQQAYGVDEDALQGQLRAAIQKVDSLDLAAQLLTDGINESSVYLLPPKTRNSNEITPFASQLMDKLSAHIKTILDPRGASYRFIGEYREGADGIDITYRLLDSNGVAQKANTVHVIPKAYKGLETAPRTVDFERLLREGVAVSGNFHADITTNLGRRDLLFKKDDEVELFVKLNQIGYFYVVGYSAKKTDKNSYLLELSESEGSRKFIQFVNADDVNKWISIGKFQVSRPYGVEGLQLIASNKDLIGSLPPTNFEPETGLYLVANTPENGVVKTRALIKKFSKQAQTSEATLMFTTEAKKDL